MDQFMDVSSTGVRGMAAAGVAGLPAGRMGVGPVVRLCLAGQGAADFAWPKSRRQLGLESRDIVKGSVSVTLMQLLRAEVAWARRSKFA